MIENKDSLISQEESQRIIGIGKKAFAELAENLNLPYIKKSACYFYKEAEIIKLRVERDKFWGKHLVKKEALKIYGHTVVNKVLESPIPSTCVTEYNSIAYSIEELETIKSEIDEFWDKHLTRYRAISNYGKAIVSKVSEIPVPLNCIKNDNTIAYSLKDLEAIKSESDEFWKKHMYKVQATNQYGTTIVKLASEIRVPSNCISNGIYFAYSIKELEKLKKNLFESKLVNTNNTKNMNVPDNIEGYLSQKDCIKLLNTSRKKLIINTKELNIQEKYIKNICYYPKDEILKYKSELEEFWDKHISLNKARNEYPPFFLKKAKCIEIPSYFIVSSGKKAYLKKELEEMFNYYKENYISSKEAEKILNISIESFRNIVKKGLIEQVLINKYFLDDCITYCLKEDVMDILNAQKEFLKDAIESIEVVETYGIGARDSCTAYMIPPQFRRLDFFKKGNYYYKKSEIEAYVNSVQKKNDATSLELDTPIETCMARLALRCEYSSFGNRPYTQQKLTEFMEERLNYVYDKYNRDFKNKKYINATVNTSADIIGHIIKFLSENTKNGELDREIYSLSTSECNLLIYSIQNKRSREIIYRFLESVQQDIYLNKKNIDIDLAKRKGFNLENIKDPKAENKKSKKNKDVNDILEEVYTFEIYSELFTFLTDTTMHLEKFFKLKSEEKQFRYLSLWLFSALQLTNAWRNIDVKDFPRLHIDDILEKNNILDIYWFKDNEVDLASSRHLITKILKHKFLISKTGEVNNFYSSDNISPVFATIIILLELCHKKSTITLVEYNEPIMYFNLKYNYPKDAIINSFFKDFISIVPNFKFSNRIINNTVLSFSKIIAPAELGILVSQHERAHSTLSSTYHYVKFPQKQMDFISEQLFERGEFGFIYDILIDILYGNKDKAELLKERTDMIVLLKNNFGGVNKVEETIKLANYHNQIEIIDMLFNMGIDGCNKTLQAINSNALQSQEPHIQCLCSESGCLEPARHPFPQNPGCIGCKYSIKNIYTLSVLGERLKSDCEEFLSSTNKIRKRKLSMRFFKYKEIILEAIKKFGKEYTYSSLGIDLPREKFANYVRQIDPPSDVLKSDLELLIERK